MKKAIKKRLATTFLSIALLLSHMSPDANCGSVVHSQTNTEINTGVASCCNESEKPVDTPIIIR